MEQKLVCIPTKEYEDLKKRAALSDDILLQLKASLDDMRAGRVRRVI